MTRPASTGCRAAQGNPGLCSESGLLTASSTNAATYLDLSVAAAGCRGNNVEPNGVLWHP